MLSHEEMIGLQAEKHDLISTDSFRSREEYVLHLIHTVAYVQAARLVENKKVLDLGCNMGYGSEILSNSANEVVGVDVSEKAILAARERYGDRGINFQLIDGKQLPFEDNEFDMLVSFQVIEHIVSYQNYIGELKRVLAPRGLVLFTTPNALLRLNPRMKPWNAFHVREFSASELESLLNTFFSKVSILGLFAREPLYSIEFNRLKRVREKVARERANNATISGDRYIRAQAKKLLPQSILTKINGIRGLLSNILTHKKRLSPVDVDFINTYGAKDFYYRCDDLEVALDLLALCSDDEDVLERFQRKLTTLNQL